MVTLSAALRCNWVGYRPWGLCGEEPAESSGTTRVARVRRGRTLAAVLHLGHQYLEILESDTEKVCVKKSPTSVMCERGTLPQLFSRANEVLHCSHWGVLVSNCSLSQEDWPIARHAHLANGHLSKQSSRLPLLCNAGGKQNWHLLQPRMRKLGYVDTR